MSRTEGWEVKLFETICKHDKPFAWGSSDCMQLALDCAEAITGRNPYPEACGYSSKRSAAVCLRKHGFSNIIEALSAAYPLIAPSRAQRGDIGIVQAEGVLSSCVCEGRHFVGKAPGSDGLIRVPRHHILQAFRVE